MQTFIILLGAAGVAAAVVWWASAPPAARLHRPRPGRRAPGRSRRGRSRPLPFTLPAATPAPGPAAPPAAASEASPEALVLERSTLPDERPSRLLALLRLVFTIAFVAALGVALLAALWLVLNNQLAGYLAR